jgi:hypothetical protein
MSFMRYWHMFRIALHEDNWNVLNGNRLGRTSIPLERYHTV